MTSSRLEGITNPLPSDPSVPLTAEDIKKGNLYSSLWKQFGLLGRIQKLEAGTTAKALAGAGTDGDLALSTSNATSGPLTSGVLTRDAYFDTLRLLPGGKLNTAQHRLFARTIDARGADVSAVHCNGNAGVGRTQPGLAIAATAFAAASGAGSSGGAGSTTNGSQGAAPSAVARGNGGAGGAESGAGGDGSGGGGGTGGPVQTGAAVTANYFINTLEVMNRMFGTTLVGGGAGGAGGGGGGGDGVTPGGGGGSGGGGAGVGIVVCDELIIDETTAEGFLSAIGGAGAAGTAAGAGLGGGGGGSGGGGGEFVLVVGRITGTGVATVDASGGAGGAGGDSPWFPGYAGDGGFGGRITVFNLSTGEVKVYTSGAPVGTVGGVCSAPLAA